MPWAADERGRDSGDPLGLRAAANRVARVLAPGLSQRSNSVRGFGLTALGLDKAKAFEDVDTALLVFERAWVLSQVDQEGRGQPVEHWAGWLRAKRLLETAPDGEPVALDRPLLTDQLSGGLWGQYRRASTVIGLLKIDLHGHTSQPRETGLRRGGGAQRLAAATKDAAFASLQLTRWLSTRQVSRADLACVKPFSGQPSQDEIQAFEEPLEAFDRLHAGALRNLRRCYDTKQPFSIDGLDADVLSEQQRNAVMTGQAIAELIETIEGPYREWVTGNRPPGPRTAAVRSRAWDRLRVGEWDCAHLLGNLQADQSWESVHHHHEWISSLRGATPWERDRPDPIRARCEPPDFGLSAPTKLFSEGVFGG